ncbi:hypothetical protein [Nocardioides sp. Root140]|uniref:hypothetical protein n=1 Tax=Nocardioides sp. Root140 TaxID=1736460 RepID=UPI000A7AC059|nr:hypothetical protein [Nocardioides sp. Root140]
MNRLRTMVTACAATVVLAGCGSSTGGDEVADEPTPTTSASSVDQVDEVTAAEQFLTLWARPNLSYAEWWAALRPLLNAAGRQAYSDTDPAVVPALRITGELEVEKSPVETYGRVRVPTDQGVFVVQLQRPSAQDRWLVTRLWFPGDTPPEL